MPRSMTAFARASDQYSWGALIWELRSVNHRFLEPHFRLPENMLELEFEVRGSLRGKLSRGKFEASLKLELSGQGHDIAIDEECARDYTRACDQLGVLVGSAAPISLVEFLKLPGVIQRAEIDRNILQKEALTLFHIALGDLLDMRQREGDILAQLLEQRLSEISEEVKTLHASLQELQKAQREKLQARMSELAIDIDVGRLEQEMVYYAQRADVAEELDRLEAHVHEFQNTLALSGSIGRRLDFLCQELNREANTLSSKSQSVDTTRAAVNIKVLIEQMREQVQNIE